MPRSTNHNPSSSRCGYWGSTFIFFSLKTICGTRLIWVALLFLLAATCVRADDLDSRFEQANKFYEEGKYSDSAAAYQKLIASGRVSSALYFNFGNALFKLGEVGRSIAAYRLAEQLSPRDPDVRANLRFARDASRGGAPLHRKLWQRVINRLSVNEWAILSVAAFWLLFACMALGEWRKESRPRLRLPIAGSALAVIVLGVCLASSFLSGYEQPQAIVVAGEAEVRNGPFEESQSAFKLRDGAEVNIVDQKGEWLQVEDPSERLGWIRKNDVLLFKPGMTSIAKS